jgi:hypothetical protein
MARKAKAGSKKKRSKRATKNLDVSASGAKRVKGGLSRYIK